MSSFIRQNPKEIDIQLEDRLGYLNKYNHIVQIGSIVNMRVHRYREQILEVKDRVGLDTVLVQDLVNDTSWRDMSLHLMKLFRIATNI